MRIFFSLRGQFNNMGQFFTPQTEQKVYANCGFGVVIKFSFLNFVYHGGE
jgi:hypothetical protein